MKSRSLVQTSRHLLLDDPKSYVWLAFGWIPTATLPNALPLKDPEPCVFSCIFVWLKRISVPECPTILLLLIVRSPVKVGWCAVARKAIAAVCSLCKALCVLLTVPWSVVISASAASISVWSAESLEMT